MLCLKVGVKESSSVPLRSNTFSVFFSVETTAIIMPLHFFISNAFCNNFVGHNNKYNRV